MGSEEKASSLPISSLVETAEPNTSPPNAEVASQTNSERRDLISKARTFLSSPHIQNQDVVAKRRFLHEKGLTDQEVDSLLNEVSQVRPHVVPPPAYPQLPPSRLPDLLIGIVRVFSWFIGGSTALIILYHRLLLPRITRTFHARQSIKSHHLTLLRKLNGSIAKFKESHANLLSILPKPHPEPEDPKFASCHSVDDIIAELSKDQELPEHALIPCDGVPEVSVLRCAIEQHAAQTEGKDATTEDLFRLVEAKLPWLTTDEAVQYENSLWNTLSTNPLFIQVDSSKSSWTYTAPTPPTPTPLEASLTSLRNALPSSEDRKKPLLTPTQRTLQSLSDFTGYITTQTYTFSTGGGSALKDQESVESEVRKDIRALKGLVLNRRNFMPSIPRPPAGVTP